MSATDSAPLFLFQTPEDAQAATQAIVSFIDSAQKTLRVLAYGFNQSDIFNAIYRAYSRGVDFKILLDHTQAAGPTEVRSLHAFFLHFPPTAIRIGTSPVKHQIMHRKAAVRDSAFVLTGSLNWTVPGPSEANDLLIIQSAVLAQAVEAEFDRIWAYVDANEAIYQPSRASFAAGAGSIAS